MFTLGSGRLPDGTNNIFATAFFTEFSNVLLMRSWHSVYCLVANLNSYLKSCTYFSVKLGQISTQSCSSLHLLQNIQKRTTKSKQLWVSYLHANCAQFWHAAKCLKVYIDSLCYSWFLMMCICPNNTDLALVRFTECFAKLWQICWRIFAGHSLQHDPCSGLPVALERIVHYKAASFTKQPIKIQLTEKRWVPHQTKVLTLYSTTYPCTDNDMCRVLVSGLFVAKYTW